jgi:ribokinase
METNAMAQRPRIVVVGSYATGLVMDVPRIPSRGETLIARNFRTTYGGKGSNMAVQAARLGAAVAFVGVVGVDSFGDAFVELMQREGIDTRHVRRTAERSTGAGFIICSDDGHNVITVDMGANELLSEADVDAAAETLAAADAVLMPLEISPAPALHAAKRARESGVTTILNPAPAQDLTGRDLSMIDYLTPNETEAAVCLGRSGTAAEADEADLAAALRDLGCGAVVMTLGERGSICFGEGQPIEAAGFAVEVRDSTGAGDAFNASLAVALAEGRPIADALRFANAFAALSTTKPDTVPSYHGRAEGEQLLSRAGRRRP